MDEIVQLIKQDSIRVKALNCVAILGLTECYIAAGFVRNCVWDSLHNFEAFTTLNDADVVYF
ncbi:nucleotidyltransferase family protein [Agarivorans sp. Alg241-V36]|uniref:nucleotidyltransferase family protein n=1 Tax=Agarivorans sp. Alg241-V36 TaxID=2305992 RepID=UPI0019685729